MRPLKRPMFKYGGDVKKQGIMHGMNGLRDGGVATTMADATGYAGGGMAMPNMRGRVTGPGGYAGLPFGGALQQPPANPNFNQQTTPTKITKASGKIGNFYDKGKTFVKSPAFSEKGIMDAAKKYGPKALNVGKGIVGTGIKRFPAVSFALAGEYLTRPTEYDKVLAEQKGYGPYESRLRKQLDFNYQRKMINLMEEQPELFDTARGITPKKKTGEGGTGNVPDAVIDPPKTQAEIEAAQKADEDKKLKRIYSLLGVDRAKRGAASKALADISRYIDEGGKDTISRKNIGSTLTKGILAFDKRLDKVDQLKEAAGLMMAKAEIEAMSDPYGKEFKKLSVEEKRKAAKDAKDPRALALTLPNFKGRTLSHADTISLAKIKNTDAVVLADSKKAKDEGIGKTITADDYVKKQIELDTSGDVAGVYVVDKVIIEVDEQGNRTQLLP